MLPNYGADPDLNVDLGNPVRVRVYTVPQGTITEVVSNETKRERVDSWKKEATREKRS